MTLGMRSVSRRAEGTCDWLGRNKVYQEWTTIGQSLLWIKGKPGSGKTTIMRFAVDEANKTSSTLTMSFFCQGRGTELQKALVGVYRAFLYQLLQVFPDSLQTLVGAYSPENSLNPKWTWTLPELKDHFVSSLRDVLDHTPVRIFADALDECGDEAAQELAGDFQNVKSQLASTRFSLAICFSSRHYPKIGGLNGCLSLSMEELNGLDIRRYVDQKLLFSPVIAQKDRETLREEVTIHSNGIFQWVILIVPKINKESEDGWSFRRILKNLYKTPQKLDEVYDRIMDSLRTVASISRSIKLFQWLCFALRPLSTSELRCAMNVDETPYGSFPPSFKHWESMDDFIETNDQMSRQLDVLSGGLAEFVPTYRNDGNLQAELIHQTVHDYMISKGFRRLGLLPQFAGSENSSDPIGVESHSSLANSCLGYLFASEVKQELGANAAFLTDLDLKYGPAKTRASLDTPPYIRGLEKRFPFLSYAYYYWLGHSRRVESLGASQKSVLGYFHYPSRNALEHANLLKQACTPPNSFSDWGRLITDGGTLVHVAAACGLVSALVAILGEDGGYASVTNAADKSNRTPLMMASACNRIECVRILVADKHIRVNQPASDGSTALTFAIRNQNSDEDALALANILLGAGATINEWVLKIAVQQTSLVLVKFLLAQTDTNANVLGNLAEHMLLHAILHRCLKVVKLLLPRTDVDVNSSIGPNSLLDCAVRNFDKDMMELLLEQPSICVNRRGQGGETALILATAWRESDETEKALQMLLSRTDIEVNVQSDSGRTALIYAAWRRSEYFVRQLLAHPNIEVNTQSNSGRTALYIAAQQGSREVVELLLARPEIQVNKADKDGVTPLMAAVSSHEIEATKLLLAHPDVEVNKPDKNSYTALMMAVVIRDEESARYFLPLPNNEVKADEKGLTGDVDKAEKLV